MHIYWNAEYASKVDNDVSYKIVITSKFVMIFIVIIVAYFDPSILKCDTQQPSLCTRKASALYSIISIGLSFIIMISVSVYFARKVYSLSKVHPHPIIEAQDTNQRPPATINSNQPEDIENDEEENAVRRLNENPNQFFKVRIPKRNNCIPSQIETFPMLKMVKRALNVNIVSLCQFAFLFPLYLVDILLFVDAGSCDDDYFANMLKLLGICGLLGYIIFPIYLEKKLEKF